MPVKFNSLIQTFTLFSYKWIFSRRYSHQHSRFHINTSSQNLPRIVLHHSLPISLPYQNQHYFEFTILFSLRVSLEQSCNLKRVLSVPQQLKVFPPSKTGRFLVQSAYRYFALPNRVRKMLSVKQY